MASPACMDLKFGSGRELTSALQVNGRLRAAGEWQLLISKPLILPPAIPGYRQKNAVPHSKMVIALILTFTSHVTLSSDLKMRIIMQYAKYVRERIDRCTWECDRRGLMRQAMLPDHVLSSKVTPR